MEHDPQGDRDRGMLSGFGLERLGLAALRRPAMAGIIIVLACLLCIGGLFRLGYSGANVDILRDGSQELAHYDELLTSFRNFNNDAVVLIRSPDLLSVKGIETYRDLHFEFQFNERVQSVLSLFSLVQYDEEKGGWLSALPAQFESDAEVAEALEKLSEEIPNSKSLFAPGSNSAVIVVYAKPDAVQDAQVRETIRQLKVIADDFETRDFSITIAGQPAIRADLINSITSDLVKLLPFAALLCALIAFTIFRAVVPVLITISAPLVSLLWLTGGMGLAGQDINFLTNILPVLVIVVVFSDALHLYLKWEGLVQSGVEAREALGEAIRNVGPACVLSAATTAIALFSLVLSHNNGLIGFGIVGGLAVIAGYAAVITVTPLVTLLVLGAGYTPKQAGAARLSSASAFVVKMLEYRFVLLIAGLGLTAAGLYAHARIDSRFQLIDYLAAGSEVSVGEHFIDEAYPGSTPLFAIVRLPDDRPLLDEANLDRFYKVLGSVGAVFPATSYYSLANFRDEIEKGGGEISEADIDSLPEYLTSRFISGDRSRVLITIFSSANLSASQMQDRLDALSNRLEATGVHEYTAITGYPVLAAVVAPRLMDNLRLSLLMAIALSVVLIAIAARSVRLGLACLVPNLLPVLCVELALWLFSVPLNLSVTVALTVAFGLAVNDSIHLLNQYMRNRGGDPLQAMDAAINQVLPAMSSTTLILSGGLAIMIASSLPAIALFSAVMILTLVFAIVFDLFQLPAHIVFFDKHAGMQGHEEKPA